MKNIVYILALFIFCFCSKQKDKVSNPEVTKNIIKPVHRLFSDYGILFVKIKGGKFGSTNAHHLKRFYNSYFSDKYPTFESFVSDALNHKILFEEEKFRGRNIVIFTLDESLKKEYENWGILPMLEKYGEKSKNDYLFRNEALPDNEFYTILYYSFLSGNTVLFDDVGGFYIVKFKDK